MVANTGNSLAIDANPIPDPSGNSKRFAQEKAEILVPKLRAGEQSCGFPPECSEAKMEDFGSWDLGHLRVLRVAGTPIQIWQSSLVLSANLLLVLWSVIILVPKVVSSFHCFHRIDVSARMPPWLQELRLRSRKNGVLHATLY
eukprot:732197-Rhodomonas_salina.1